MRLALALIIGLAACSSARADDPWKPVLDLFRRKPAVTHAPPDAPAAIERALIDAELQAAIKRANEAAEKAEEAAKAAAEKAATEARDPKSPDIKPKPKPKAKPPLDIRADPACTDARRGVSMTCQDIRANAWIYNLYSDAKKAHSQSCLTQAERDRIAACFQ